MAFVSAPVQWRVKSIQRFDHFQLAEVIEGETSQGLALLFKEQSRCLQHFQRLKEAACGGVLKVKGKYMLDSRFALLCEKGKLAARQMEEYPEEIQPEELMQLAKGLLSTLRDLHAKRVSGLAIQLTSVVLVEEEGQLLRLFDFRVDTNEQTVQQAQDVYDAGAFLFCMTVVNSAALPSEPKARKALVLERTAHMGSWGRFLLDMLETSRSAAELYEDLENPSSASYRELYAPLESPRPAAYRESSEVEESFLVVLEWLAHDSPEAATRELSAMLAKAQNRGERLEVRLSNPMLTCCSCSETQGREYLLRLVCLHYICEGCLQKAAKCQPSPCFGCSTLLELQSQETSRLRADLQESYAAYAWQLAP